VKEPEKFVALLKMKEEPVIREILEHMYLDENLLHFYADHWKWYDESESALSEIAHMADKYDGEFKCKFARYGEESEDIEEQAFGENGWDLEYPYVVRNIELGFNPETAIKLID
jgi:hypothetical protein